METKTAVENAMLTNAIRVVGDSAFDDDKKGLCDRLNDDAHEWMNCLPKHAHATFEKYCKRTAMYFINASFDKQTGLNNTVKIVAMIFKIMTDLQKSGKLEMTDRLIDCLEEVSEIMEKEHGKVWDGLLSSKSFSKQCDKAMSNFNEWGYYA